MQRRFRAASFPLRQRKVASDWPGRPEYNSPWRVNYGGLPGWLKDHRNGHRSPGYPS